MAEGQNLVMAEAQLTTSRFCLEKATIRSVPATAIYIPNFISPQEEELLLQKVLSLASQLAA